MEIIDYHIKGLYSFASRVFEDDRGHFFESYNQNQLSPILGDTSFVQDNQSLSKKGVLRGLHFQKPPYDQGKLVRVIKGSVLDVAVDIRINSPTYGMHQTILLSEENKINFWIPSGFAHGFVALEEDTIFAYKCTNYYHSASEDALIWNDPDLAIDWGVSDPLVSEKDQEAKLFKDFNSPF